MVSFFNETAKARPGPAPRVGQSPRKKGTSDLVRSEAALLLLLLVDSESELERGRRVSFRYTRKLSVTGWFPPSNPLLGRPAHRSGKNVEATRA